MVGPRPPWRPLVPVADAIALVLTTTLAKGRVTLPFGQGTYGIQAHPIPVDNSTGCEPPSGGRRTSAPSRSSPPVSTVGLSQSADGGPIRVVRTVYAAVAAAQASTSRSGPKSDLGMYDAAPDSATRGAYSSTS